MFGGAQHDDQGADAARPAIGPRGGLRHGRRTSALAAVPGSMSPFSGVPVLRQPDRARTPAGLVGAALAWLGLAVLAGATTGTPVLGCDAPPEPQPTAAAATTHAPPTHAATLPEM